MRIRKNASRLLGSASAFSHPPPLPPPLPLSPPGLSVCELNCSPWDLINTTPGPKEAEEEDGRGIAGICAELIKVEEPITATATADTQTSAGSAAEMKIEEEEEIKELILEEEEDQVIEKKAEEEAIKCCNKRGKGWHCTRPAELSHSFCNYHLTKLRSYLSNRGNNKTEAVRSTENRSQSKKRKPKKTAAAAAAEAESDSNSYYCYGGFGPWRGKRRGGANVKVKDKEEILCNDLMHLDDSSADGDSNVGDDDNNDVEYIDHHKVVEKREEGIIYCRKHDGKGWHCKRPAEPPHSFCSHHLAQFRSYHRSNHSKFGTPPLEEHSAIEPDSNKKKPPVKKKKKKKKKTAAAAAVSPESNFYYFYSGFGPWRGKTRGVSRADDVKVEEEIVKEISDNSHDSAVMVPEGAGDDDEGAEDSVRTRSLKSLL